MNKKLKILTYNIHKGFRIANVRFVLSQMRIALEKVNPDVIFLQEIVGEHAGKAEYITGWPNKPQFKFLAENLWPFQVYGKNALYKKGHHGNAVLSKFQFFEWENIDVSRFRRTSRSLLHCTLDVPSITTGIHTICIHFALLKSERKKQLTMLKKRITSCIPDAAPLIIAGDFNDWRGQAEHYLETEINLQEVFKVKSGHHAKTFPSWNPKLPVDRIYYRGLELETCQRLSGEPWRKLSDHLPLYAEFSLPLIG